MDKTIVLSLLATLTVGGIAGAGITHQLMTTVQVTCPVPIAKASPPSDFFKSRDLPFTGKQY